MLKTAVSSSVELCPRAEDVFDGAHTVELVTEWSDYQMLDWATLKHRQRHAIVVDGRNALEDLNGLGFRYFGMGRSPHPLAAEPASLELNGVSS
jgi:hypothetical protein